MLAKSVKHLWHPIPISIIYGAPCVVFSGAHRPYESRVVGMDGGAHQGIRARHPREHRAPNQLQRYHICFILWWDFRGSASKYPPHQ